MTKDEALKLALEALEIYGFNEYPLAIKAITAIQAALAQPPLPVQPAEEWSGQSNIESPHNACQHRGYCKQLKAQPPLPVQEPLEQLEALRQTLQLEVDRLIAAKHTWVGLMRGVRVDGETVVVSVRGGNDAARELCGALIKEIK
jgi:hypothetical protein